MFMYLTNHCMVSWYLEWSHDEAGNNLWECFPITCAFFRKCGEVCWQVVTNEQGVVWGPLVCESPISNTPKMGSSGSYCTITKYTLARWVHILELGELISVGHYITQCGLYWDHIFTLLLEWLQQLTGPNLFLAPQKQYFFSGYLYSCHWLRIKKKIKSGTGTN